MEKRQRKKERCLDDLIWSGIWKFIIICSCLLLSFGISTLRVDFTCKIWQRDGYYLLTQLCYSKERLR